VKKHLESFTKSLQTLDSIFNLSVYIQACNRKFERQKTGKIKKCSSQNSNKKMATGSGRIKPAHFYVTIIMVWIDKSLSIFKKSHCCKKI